MQTSFAATVCGLGGVWFIIKGSDLNLKTTRVQALQGVLFHIFHTRAMRKSDVLVYLVKYPPQLETFFTFNVTLY